MGPRPRGKELLVRLHDAIPEVAESLNVGTRVRSLEGEQRTLRIEGRRTVEFLDRSRKCRSVRSCQVERIEELVRVGQVGCLDESAELMQSRLDPLRFIHVSGRFTSHSG